MQVIKRATDTAVRPSAVDPMIVSRSRARAGWLGALGGLLLIGAGIGGAWFWSVGDEAPAVPAPLQAPAAVKTEPAAALAAKPEARAAATLIEVSVPPSAADLQSVAALDRWLHEKTSLRGAGLAGSWGVDNVGQLKPSLALRVRFDQLLSLREFVKGSDLASYTQEMVTQQHGAAASQAVMLQLQNYMILLGQTFTHELDSSDRSEVKRALDERHAARRLLLGDDWAHAYFASEEAAAYAAIGEPRPR